MVEDTASIPPAIAGLTPCRFIAGIVNAPDVTTLDVALPEIVPNRAEEMTVALIAVPLPLPASLLARISRAVVPPATSKAAPNRR
jgi:hypothetical protein